MIAALLSVLCFVSELGSDLNNLCVSESIFASQTHLSVDQRTDCGSVSTMEDKQYWCEQWVYAHREGYVTEEKKYVAKKKCKLNIFVSKKLMYIIRLWDMILEADVLLQLNRMF